MGLEVNGSSWERTEHEEGDKDEVTAGTMVEVRVIDERKQGYDS
jgi:hypothetical protein